MEILLGRYAVGTGDCLTDPGLVAIAQDFRRQAQARIKPIDEAGIKKLPVARYHVSRKIDGEFNCLVYHDGEAILVNPGGTVLAGLPDLESAAWHLQAAGIRTAVIAGELWYERADGGRERAHDVTRVARRPESEAELLDLRFSAFDLIRLDGKQRWDSYEEVLATLEELHLATPSHCLLDKADDILKQFRAWTDDGYEGIVLCSDIAGSYKIKPRHSIDAVVIGFTEATDDRRGMIHDLLVALMRADGTFHVLGRVGSGFSEDERREFLCDLQDLIVGSDYVETTDGVAYRMVWPKCVVEISILDLIVQSTRGEPIRSMVLDWESTGDRGDGCFVGCWRTIRKLPMAAMISPQFVRRRDDKSVNPVDLRLEQITSLVEVPLADRDARRFTLPKSEFLRRVVYTKQLKGQTMVRKLVMWQTNKAEDQESGVRGQDFPACVIAFTDYSPNRKTPLERDIRVSNSREQIDELWGRLVKEYIVKGWTRSDQT
jgi:hypothetical protein